ncbi:hypothetical protein HNR23_004830 [Nocardiopsis mwathae]|uniref:Secreted protein n=1 Tax=Nocardiopsis mwathae TaxID=1472723 RepID=A0A7X0D7W4_9ACTN|nr:hypothetical protein [Nocardiopsis mwathae]MBB6174770.1 hypothetical protein [Nocardiopsis mwathae]
MSYGKPMLGIAALAGALLLGGCAQLGFGDDAPDTSEDSASGSAGGGTEADGVKFAQCMRDNGVDVPDPKGDGMMPALPVEGDDEDAVKNALEKCEDLMPMPEDDRPEEEIFQDNLEMAKCLRENGIDVEDPKKGEGLAIDLGGGDEKKMEEAMKACGEMTGGGPSITRGDGE